MKKGDKNNQMNESPRVIVVGNSGVGKTSMVTRVASGHFDKLTTPTIGAGVTPLSYKIKGKTVNFQVWDTAGQEIFRNVVPLYFRGAAVAIIVYSIVDNDSFSDLNQWLIALKDHCEEAIPVITVANKCDMMQKYDDLKQGKEWAAAHNFPFFSTSAATGENINQLFELVASLCAETEVEPEADVTVKAQEKSCC